MKTKICKKCKKEFLSKLVTVEKIHNLQHRKYCLECSPFKEHNTKKLEFGNYPIINGEKFCVGCNTKKSITEFYTQYDKSRRIRKYCKSCSNNFTLTRQKTFKKRCVDYKGGKCELCGYYKSLWALEFHHKNPKEKDFVITKAKSKSFDDDVLKELNKCMLLCSNCHREQHEKQFIQNCI